MRTAPRDQIGLSLGAWGAVQTTAAGVAIAIGGMIRDAVLITPGSSAAGAEAYVPVFALEAALLALTLVVAWPLLRQRLDRTDDDTTFDVNSGAGAQDSIVTTKA